MKCERLFSLLLFVAVSVVNPSAYSSADGEADRSDYQWWRGNLHTHSLWSDGSSYPELVADWYKENGYHFLAMSEHNVLPAQKWIHPVLQRFTRGTGEAALQRYRERFGDDWVETRVVDEAFRQKLLNIEIPPSARRYHPPGEHFELGETVVRVKPLYEYRHLLEEPGRFLLLKSEEVSANHAVHVNAINLEELIIPRPAKDALDAMRFKVNSVYEQRMRTGRSMFAFVNHPNYRWAVTPEDLALVEKLRFFEVYNGHPGSNHAGDETRVGTEKMWDIVLTRRLAELDFGIVYGLGTDDAHEYHGDGGPGTTSPGRAWVMVRAARLTPEHLVDAMERGDFYASTGVTLRDIRFNGRRLEIEIDPDNRASYVTRFIGTRRGYDRSDGPGLGEEGNPLPEGRRYSEEIGEILAEVEGIAPSYELTGDEIYVRAQVVSSLLMENPPGDHAPQTAWVQPVTP